MIYIPENESMQRETIGEDGHTSHAQDDVEIADYTPSTQAYHLLQGLQVLNNSFRRKNCLVYHPL